MQLPFTKELILELLARVRTVAKLNAYRSARLICCLLLFQFIQQQFARTTELCMNLHGLNIQGIS